MSCRLCHDQLYQRCGIQQCDSVTPEDCDFLGPEIGPPCLSNNGVHSLATIETQARQYSFLPAHDKRYISTLTQRRVPLLKWLPLFCPVSFGWICMSCSRCGIIRFVWMNMFSTIFGPRLIWICFFTWKVFVMLYVKYMKFVQLWKKNATCVDQSPSAILF